MSDPLRKVLDALTEKGCAPKAAGEGKWTARCPAHDSKHRCLSVTTGKDGRVLLRDQSKQCAPDEIVAALDLTMADLFPAKAPVSTRRAGATRGQLVKTYDYRDAGGALLFQVCRYEPKTFRQRRPDGKGGWTWNLDGVPRVLYRLPELLKADQADPVLIVEGEKDADALADVGLLATTNPGGAGKWSKLADDSALHGRRVFIIPDRDDAGRRHAEDVARRLCGKAADVRLVELPGEHVKDVSDWIDSQAPHGPEDLGRALLALADATPAWTAHAQGPGAADDTDGDSETGGTGAGQRPTWATLLVDLCAEADLFHAPGGDGLAYGTVRVGDHDETMLVSSGAFRRWIVGRFYSEYGRAPSAATLTDALAVIQAKAVYEGPARPVGVRLMHLDGAVYLDLADDEWHAVEVRPDGWRVLVNPPVRFRRPRGMLALPIPVSGGRVDELLRFLNLDDADWPLVVGWLIAALNPVGSFPVLALNGEQGSAKSTTARMFRALIDPNAAPLRAEPREPRDLMITAGNAWLMVIDNVSGLSGWLSDALCRLSTGGGFATRELYSDCDERLFDAQRPTIVTGIEDCATRSDLSDRTLHIILPPVPDEWRRPETDLWRDFDAARPRLLGALLDAVSAALRNLPETHLPRLPRMADFALWATAAESALCLPAGAFLSAYEGNRAAANETVIETSPIGPALLRFIDQRGEWAGTCRELLADLDQEVDERIRAGREWPRTARKLGGILRRLAPNLRRVGIDLAFDREGKAGARIVHITRVGYRPSASSASSAVKPTGAKPPVSADGMFQPDGLSNPHRQHRAAVASPKAAQADNADGADGRIRTLSTEDELPAGPDRAAGRRRSEEIRAEFARDGCYLSEEEADRLALQEQLAEESQSASTSASTAT